MSRFILASLLLLIGCAAKPPTVTEVPETLTITTCPLGSASGPSGTAVLYNVDSNGGSWAQTIAFPMGTNPGGVTYTMSVYQNSTGGVTINAPAGYCYSFGNVSGTTTGPGQVVNSSF